MSIALARIFSFVVDGSSRSGLRVPAAFTVQRATQQLEKGCHIVRAGARGPRRGDGDGAAARRGELRLIFPQKTVNRRASDEGLAVSY